jgi:hypothetical protein
MRISEHAQSESAQMRSLPGLAPGTGNCDGHSTHSVAGAAVISFGANNIIMIGAPVKFDSELAASAGPKTAGEVTGRCVYVNILDRISGHRGGHIQGSLG